jgi:murein DD-endopeptidase MepM/ murein hydrolase activator NlpD
MVSVPINNARRVQTERLPGNRFNYAQADTSMVGRAVEGLGRQLGQTAEVVDEIEKVRDTTDALNADTAASATFKQLKTEFSSLTGEAPAEQQAAFLERAEQAREALLTGARSDRARSMTARQLDIRFGDFQGDVYTHSLGQSLKAKEVAEGAQISTAIVDAVDNRNDPVQQATYFGVAMESRHAQLVRQGVRDPATMKLAMLETSSKIWSDTAYAMDAEDGEPTRAMQLVKDKSAEILPEVEKALMNSLSGRVTGAWAERTMSGILSSMPVGSEAPVSTETRDVEFRASPLLSGGGRTVAGGRYGAERSYGGHSGVDFAEAAGAAVAPTADGTVIASYYDAAYGNRVEVDHGGGYITTYSHMDGRKVAVGDRVDASTVIGGVGNTGSASRGNHVHYEMLVNGEKGDPVKSAKGIGAPGVPSDARLNRQAVVGQVEKFIAANPNLSEREQNALRDAAEKQVSMARSDRAQAEADADRVLDDWVDNNIKGEIMSVDQIPAAIWGAASPTVKSAWRSAARSNVEAAERKQNTALTKEHNRQMAAREFEILSLPDAEFANMNLRSTLEFFGETSEGLAKAKSLMQAQKAAKKTGGNLPDKIRTQLDGDLGTAYKLNRGPDATPAEREKWSAVYNFVLEDLGDNMEPTKEELRAAIMYATSKAVTKKGWAWSNTEMTQAEAKAQGITPEAYVIPSKFRQQIINELNAEGISPTGEAMNRWYQQGVADGRFDAR